MHTPEIPQNESARLTVLRSLNILDTSPEERFDRLTRMAKRIFGVPIALANLVDENRQWFNSCAGLGASDTPADVFFCSHAILGDEPFVIPEAKADERFANNPLVTSHPHIRFYTGCPLRAANSSKTGTLCIVDRQPRKVAIEDIEPLQDLALMVEQEIASVQLATLDELTGISNRRGFMMLAEHSLNLCTRQEHLATLVFLDLDNFKPINDRYEHAEGDRALKTFADHLKGAFRDSDLFARMGGDEFAVLLTNTAKDFTWKTIARFAETLDDDSRRSNRRYQLAFSCGVVEFGQTKHPTIEELLADGDTLMYEIKHAKKQRSAPAGSPLPTQGREGYRPL